MRTRTMRQGLESHAKRLHAWTIETSFPFWATTGLHETGASWEAIEFSGGPVQNDESRVRVQARQLISFALAHQLGWNAKRSSAIVAQLFHVLRVACRRPDGLYGRTMSVSELALIDDTADLYDNAFVLLALSHAQSVLGAAAVGDEINALLHAFDGYLRRAPDQGYFECLPPPPFRLQNPHMHLFESLLAVYAGTRDDAIKARLDQLYAFIEDAFFSDADAIVREIQGSAEPSHNGYFEPGHSFEWVWLLGWRSRLLSERLPDYAVSLYSRALESLDASHRALMKVSVSGESLDSSTRLWSQTEALKAHLCMAELGPNGSVTAAVTRAQRCSTDILEQWLQPAIQGGWHDHFDAQNTLIAKDIPASTGYHLFVAIAELVRVAGSDDLGAGSR